MAQNTGTPNFLPWPDYTDDADGPDAFENLARAVDIAIKGLQNQAAALATAVSTKSLAVSDGLTLGSHTVRNEALLDIRNLSSPGHAVTTRLYTRTSDGATILQNFDGSTVKNQLHLLPTGDIARVAGTRVEYLPFAVFTGSLPGFSVTAGAGHLQTKRINFPAGRFTQIPAIALATNNPDLLLSIKAQSTAWLDVEAAANMDKGATGSGHVIAIQMLANDAFY